jgi:hypothetical protein
MNTTIALGTAASPVASEAQPHSGIVNQHIRSIVSTRASLDDQEKYPRPFYAYAKQNYR